MYQQNLDKFNLTIAVLNSSTSKMKELAQFMPSFKAQVEKLEKYKAYIIDKQGANEQQRFATIVRQQTKHQPCTGINFSSIEPSLFGTKTIDIRL